MLLEPRPAAGPIAYRVPLGEDELEGRIGQSACAGRSLRRRGVLGMGGGRPAEDHQDRDGNAAST